MEEQQIPPTEQSACYTAVELEARSRAHSCSKKQRGTLQWGMAVIMHQKQKAKRQT